MRPGPHNAITDVAGVQVGQHQRIGRGWLTGTTVVLPPEGTVGGVDVRGGGPGTRETELLRPENMVDRVDAVCLTGGSAFGLAAATGVVDWLAERDRGLPIGPQRDLVVPIVPAAVLFDLGLGRHRPDASFGYRAAAAASSGRVRQGNVGAGAGAHAGGLKGGVGTASAVLDGGITVGALVAANPGGSVVDPRTGELWGARYGLDGEFAHLRRPSRGEVRSFRVEPPVRPFNTTLVVVATDARLDKSECTRLAMMAHDGMARAISPVHLYSDGDVAFALATGDRGVPDLDAVEGAAVRPQDTRLGQLGLLMAAAADCVARAIVHAVLAAQGTTGLSSYLDRFPSARRP